MNITYNAELDQLYITLADHPATDSMEIVDGVVLDVMADGSIVGINIEHASHKFDVDDVVVKGLAMREQSAELSEAA